MKNLNNHVTVAPWSRRRSLLFLPAFAHEDFKGNSCCYPILPMLPLSGIFARLGLRSTPPIVPVDRNLRRCPPS
jgi:hypothetical protein